MAHFNPSVLRRTSLPRELFPEWPAWPVTAVADPSEVPRDSFRPLGLLASGAWPDGTRNSAPQLDACPALTAWRGRPATGSGKNDGLATPGPAKAEEPPVQRGVDAQSLVADEAAWRTTPPRPPLRGRNRWRSAALHAARAASDLSNPTTNHLHPGFEALVSAVATLPRLAARGAPGPLAPTRHGAGVRSHYNAFHQRLLRTRYEGLPDQLAAESMAPRAAWATRSRTRLGWLRDVAGLCRVCRAVWRRFSGRAHRAHKLGQSTRWGSRGLYLMRRELIGRARSPAT